MSYLVLARKWRPQRFEEVVGQQHVTRTLSNAIEQDRVAHAFLFTGSRGVGKTSAARLLAKALNCEQGPTPRPCNACPSCLDITQGRAVDVIEIDGASNRGINEIRELREAVRYAPSQGRRKVYIIDEVHMLTTEAFNALLKTLEEPPAHALFVLATTEPRKIPVTILSRCQRYDFKRIPRDAIVKKLAEICEAEGLHFERPALDMIARQARGGMRDALSSLDQVIAFATDQITEANTADILGIAGRKHLLLLGRTAITRDPAAALLALDEVDRFGHDLAQLAVTLLQHLRDLTVIAAIDDPRGLVDLGEGDLALCRDLVKGVPIAHLERLFQVFSRAVEQLQHTNHPRMLLEMALIRLTAIEPLVPIEPLVRKLQSLEKALSGDRELSQQVLDRYHTTFQGIPPSIRTPRANPPPTDPEDPPPGHSSGAAHTTRASLPPNTARTPNTPAPPAVNAAPPTPAREPEPEPVAPTQADAANPPPGPQGQQSPEGAPQARSADQGEAAQAQRADQVEAAQAQRADQVEAAQTQRADQVEAARAQRADQVEAAQTQRAEAAQPHSADDVTQQRWIDLVERVRQDTPLLAGTLERGMILSFDATSLEFWLPDRYGGLVAAQDREKVERYAELVTGLTPQLKIFSSARPPQGARPSVAELRKHAITQQLEQQRHQIATDGLLAAALRCFGISTEQVSIQVTSNEREHSS